MTLFKCRRRSGRICAARACSSASSATHPPPPGIRLNGKAISSDYGPRNAPGGSRFHAGLDIPVSVGTPVYAIADGVVQSDPGLSSDHILVLRHSDHFKTGYAHLESWLVEIDPNELITQGQLIGYSGDWVSNAHKSPHLHIDSGYDIVDGKASGALFYNPLHYLPYTNVYSNGISNFTSNTTRGRAIDIEPAAGDQDKVLVAFGLTTGYDKDLNYIKVQVDGRTDRGQYFVLNYDEVIKQDSNTGVVDLSNGRRFRIRDDDIYNDAALGYDFYVVPGSTTINQTASDHFFFPFMIGEDEGPLDIVITAEEVNGARKEWNATVGAEISPVGSEVNGRQLTIRFDVTYHDVMSGSIHLEAKGLPAGWSAAFDHQNLNLAPEEQAQVTLTLTAPNLIEPDRQHQRLFHCRRQPTGRRRQPLPHAAGIGGDCVASQQRGFAGRADHSQSQCAGSRAGCSCQIERGKQQDWHCRGAGPHRTCRG